MPDSYCHIDNELESTEGAYLVCPECGHVYRTPDAVLRAYNDVATHVTVMVSSIMFCPLCLHDFPFYLKEPEVAP